MMDKERRSRLKRVVTEARKVVEGDVRVQLRRLGFDESGKVKPVEELPHLSSEDKELRGKILEAVEKEKIGGISDREAFDRYVRHVGFTYVNRIAALRAMEVRGLIKETVVRRDVYGGRSLREYEIAERERILDPYGLLKAGLIEAFEEVSAEIRVLFDVNNEYSLVFPGHKALLELTRLLSEEVPEEDWKEDDIIGWIYQYYNEEAREQFKEAGRRRKPKADDIPVINQFYTPRWVVRVLVDNTLGRLWLEMNERCPKLGDPVKRIREQFENPSGNTVEEFCAYLVPLSQEPPPKERKKAREIKVLDPACGSGHFLVYAFDVLYRMYEEDEPDIPKEEIPRLILENNLFGIDIDLRAVQLAALSLYLKAKWYNRRLKVSNINLVCADARISDSKVRKIFLNRFSDDPELQKIFAKIFEDLEYTFEVGSLLRVREPFERLLEKRREGGMQAVLFPRVAGQTIISKSGKIEGQTELAMSILDKMAKQETNVISKAATLDQMLGALREFEKEAMEKRDMGTLLFATEAEKSVGLVALLSEKYDVVLMNPAYGTMPSRTKEYAKKNYSRTKNDYYATFIEQAVDLAEKNGFVGMLTSRTFIFLKSFQALREDILWNEAVPQLMLDTGFGILDGAIVETAATVLRKIKGISPRLPSEEMECSFCRLTMFDTYEKEDAFMRSLLTYLKESDNPLWYRVTLGDLAQVPGSPYTYWASTTLRVLFVNFPPLDRDVARKPHELKIADVNKGLDTSDDKRFTRRHWEVEKDNVGRGKKWVPIAKAGAYDLFYGPIDWVINWENDGQEVKRYEHSNIRNETFYFKSGLTFTNKPSPNKKYFAVRYLPEGVIFSVGSPGIFSDKSDLWSIMGLMSSRLSYYLLSLRTAEHNWEVGTVAILPIPVHIKKMSLLGVLARESYDPLREWDTGSETSPVFIKPWILQILHGFRDEEKPITGHPFVYLFRWNDWDLLKEMRFISGNSGMSLRELSALAMKREEIMQKRLDELQRRIDEEVYRFYDIREEDQKLIEKELALRRGEFSFTQGEIQESGEEQAEMPMDVEAKTAEHVARLVSFYIKKALEADTDGVIPLHQLVKEVRKYLAKDFGADLVAIKEKEIEEIFGKSLEAWIATDYFDFHVKLYKRRPIFWHLSSSNFARTRGPIGNFNCLLHYHKLDRDTIPKIRMNYLRPELDRAKWKVDRLKRELQEARDKDDKRKERRLSEELDSALSILEELQNFRKALEEVHNPRKEKTKLPKNARWVDQKIAEVRDNGYNPLIDYGVRVNIEPLKEAGLLHKAAQRVK